MGVPYQERYFRWVKPWTDHVIFVCEFVRQQLDPRLGYPPQKCSVIRNGIRQERFLSHPASPGAVRPRIRFGTVGRLVPAKGHSVLIDAFASIAPKLPEAELRIFGYGLLEQELRAQIQRLGMEGRIFLEGRTDDASRVFESLDIFVFSSLNEGLPLVILEAMTAGLPIVSTRIGGVPEIAPEPQVAWLCEPGNVEELAGAMLRAAESQNLEGIGREARRLAAENYGITQMCRGYEALYRTLLDGR
jgi:glycosyltransferase involved in cell wall biosynthesis